MKPKNFVGVGLLLLFGALLLVNFGDQVGGYMHFAEAKESGEAAHIVGEWVPNSETRYDPETNIFAFHMQDNRGLTRQVQYRKPKAGKFSRCGQDRSGRAVRG